MIKKYIRSVALIIGLFLLNQHVSSNERDSVDCDAGYTLKKEGYQNESLGIDAMETICSIAIEDFIRKVSRLTGENFILDPRVKGNINLIFSKDINKENALQTLGSLLEIHDFALVIRENVNIIVPANIAYKMASREKSGLIDSTLQSKTYELKYIRSRDILPEIREMVRGFGFSATAFATNSLYVKASPRNIKEIDALIEKVDVPSEIITEVILLKYSCVGEFFPNITNAESGYSLVDVTPNIALNAVAISGKSLDVELKKKSILALDERNKGHDKRCD